MKLPAGMRTIRGQVGQSWNRFPSLDLPRGAVDGTGISGPLRRSSRAAAPGAARPEARSAAAARRRRPASPAASADDGSTTGFACGSAGDFVGLGLSSDGSVRRHLEFLAPALRFVGYGRRGKKPQERRESLGSLLSADSPITPIPPDASFGRRRPDLDIESTLRRCRRGRCPRCIAGCRPAR